MIKANIEEDWEATMAKFIGGLNKEIVDEVDKQIKSKEFRSCSSSRTSWNLT